MTFSEAISSGFRNYVGFSGRASRSEFWYWVLFSVLVSIALSIIDLALLSGKTTVLSSIWSLATLLPSLAVGVRRLHDTDRSGWWDQLHSSGRHYRADRLLVSRGNSRLEPLRG